MKTLTQFLILAAQFYPTKLTVSSTGITKDLQPHVFKTYDLLVDYCVNERPVWHFLNRKYIYSPSDKSWVIGNPIGASGWVHSVEKGLTEIPSTGWKVYNSTSWLVDSELTIEKSTSLAALICTTTTTTSSTTATTTTTTTTTTTATSGGLFNENCPLTFFLV